MTPDSLEDLRQLMKIVSRLFSFRFLKEPRIREVQNQFDWGPLLSHRLSHIKHEVFRTYDITQEIMQMAEGEAEVLKIERGYATDFAIELVSSSISLFSEWTDLHYDDMLKKLFRFLFDLPKPDRRVKLENEKEVPVFPVVACKIILADNFSELASFAEGLDLRETRKGLYIGGESIPVKENMFNFLPYPWSDLYIPNTIAVVKPEKLPLEYYRTDDYLNYLITMIHSIGKFYVIYESIGKICANLEWSSWYLSRLFTKYESQFCWIQRIFSDKTKSLSEIENEIREQVFPLTRIETAPDAITLIEEQYGEDIFDVNYRSFIETVDDSRLKEFSWSKKISGEEVKESILGRLKLLAKKMIDFNKQFEEKANFWKGIWRSSREKNQLLVALFGVIFSLVLEILLRRV